MNEERLVFEIAKQENRPNPYPLYAQARQVGICRQHDGAYVVSRYREVSALLHDPRVSSDPRNLADPRAAAAGLPVHQAGRAEPRSVAADRHEPVRAT